MLDKSAISEQSLNNPNQTNQTLSSKESIFKKNDFYNRRERLRGKDAVIGYLKLILLSYDHNIEEYLEDIDQEKYEEMKTVLHIAPGYKPVRMVYGFYTHKYGIAMGTFLALLYPLPYSLLFLFTFLDFQVPFLAIFVLAGMRSGAIGIHIKYFLHWPRYQFQWIVLLFTAIISITFENSIPCLIQIIYSFSSTLYLCFSPSSSRMNSGMKQRGRRTQTIALRLPGLTATTSTMRGSTSPRWIPIGPRPSSQTCPKRTLTPPLLF